MLLYPSEKQYVDFATIHANTKDEIALTFRDFGEYKFVRLAEVTFYWRVWKFWDVKTPVYDVLETLRFDDAMDVIGISMDAMKVPGKPAP